MREFLRIQISLRRERIARLRERADNPVWPGELESAEHAIERDRAELEHWEAAMRLYREEHPAPQCLAVRYQPGGRLDRCPEDLHHAGEHAWRTGEGS